MAFTLLGHQIEFRGSPRARRRILIGFSKTDSRKAAKNAKMKENRIGREIVGASVTVHRELGPGRLETAYEVVLLDELRKQGLRAERQVPVAIVCRDVRFDEERDHQNRQWSKRMTGFLCGLCDLCGLARGSISNNRRVTTLRVPQPNRFGYAQKK